MEEYNKSLKRVKEIVNYIDDNSKHTKLSGDPSFAQSLQMHKLYIREDNPLQILVSEGIYLLQLINNYEKC
jgi:hypothetical protein